MAKNVALGYVYINGYHDGKQPFEGTPENIANFIMYNQDHYTIVTDRWDLFLVSSMPGGFLDRVRDMDLRDDILEHLLPMQMGDKEPVDVVKKFDLERKQEALDALAEEKALYMDEDMYDLADEFELGSNGV